MKRYDIANDFRQKFINENENVWSKSIVSTYFSINDEDVKVSSNPYSMETSEHGLVVFSYKYTVITQEDICLVPLFFSSSGEIEDYIEIDGWKLSFSKPITALTRCNLIYVYIKKDALSIKARVTPWNIDKEFPCIWKLFSLVRNCTTQLELDLLKKLFDQEKKLDELKLKDLRQEAKLDALNMQLESYKNLLHKIEELVEK